MNPDRWAEVERLYHDTLACVDSERAAFLRDACVSNESLRQEVESLLAHDSAAQRFLVGPAIDIVPPPLIPADAVPTSLVGRRLGSYEITALIGSGLVRAAGGGLAVAFDLRLPTGDAKNLATAGRPSDPHDGGRRRGLRVLIPRPRSLVNIEGRDAPGRQGATTENPERHRAYLSEEQRRRAGCSAGRM